MSVEAKPLFRPDELHSSVDVYALPPHDSFRPKLEPGAVLIRSERINNFRQPEAHRRPLLRGSYSSPSIL